MSGTDEPLTARLVTWKVVEGVCNQAGMVAYRMMVYSDFALRK